MEKILIVGNSHENNSSKIFLNSILAVINKIFSNIIVISANEPEENYYNIWLKTNIVVKNHLLFFLYSQLIICKLLILNRTKYNYVLFLMEPNPFPVLICKILNKKIFTFIDGRQNGLLIYIMSKFSFIYSNKLIVATKNLIQIWKIDKHLEKIHIARYYIDINKFYKYTPIENRDQTILFVGRFSAEKGICEFIKSAKLLCDKYKQLKFILCGNGPLYDYIRLQIINHPQIIVHDWVDNSQLIHYYNKAILTVIPSYYEGGPITALESMACGTPILSTQVGLIPEIIKHNENGFVLNDNDPESIFSAVEKILLNDDLPTISVKAQKTISNSYLKKHAEQIYKDIFLK